MSLFNFKKKMEESNDSCCGGFCNTNTSEKENDTNNISSSVKILGGGCDKCHKLGENAVEALKQLNMNIDIEYVTDFAIIATYGVMQTPALVYNEKVLSYGKVLKSDEIVKLISRAN